MTSEVIEDEKQFYSKAKTYWKQIPPTVDGMLGGYGHISSIDINSSRKFLQRFLREGPNKTGTSCALDCGAGIGRITKRLLLPLFREVDMVDITEDFLVQAKTYLGEEGKRVSGPGLCTPAASGPVRIPQSAQAHPHPVLPRTEGQARPKRPPHRSAPGRVPAALQGQPPPQRHHRHQRQHGPGGRDSGRRGQQRVPGP
ncbi:N-terminal Xaa-Pro-Lys N-methyltransferase 1 isoform X2 [Gorilla gorilla gorilla]|uniref:N-terminal Xaa-Pro-Lys N-methyltransferase 1 isoform X2 n=1 Tax=Gorilla gorilla gorilla TaxID=9595 RepID=UPI00244588DE|nr:N-terminal Xaa-Pro-Lys N-methyltransferase 1 isoform X2 [Gorilla gorilla gorilla]